MKLLNADFVTSAARADGIPRDDVARVALAGRSNVGKSSLINALCQSKIARTSAAPGKTRLLNFYRITMEGGPGGPGRWPVYLVDLPGYGYARGGDESAEELAAIAEDYYADSGAHDARLEVAPCALGDAAPGRLPASRSAIRPGRGRMAEPYGHPLPHRRDEDGQAGAQRARQEPEGT